MRGDTQVQAGDTDRRLLWEVGYLWLWEGHSSEVDRSANAAGHLSTKDRKAQEDHNLEKW